MTDKELKKLKRSELLSMLLDEVRENEALRRQIDEIGAELKDKRTRIANAGSIAEASLQLTRIFEDAQAAADQYLMNIRQLEERWMDEPDEVGQEVLNRQASEEVLESARREAEEIREKARQDADRILDAARKSRKDALECWDEIRRRVEALDLRSRELDALLSDLPDEEEDE